jgi:hypothetical protein
MKKRPALVAAGIGTLLLGLAAPAMATTTAPVRPAARTASHSAIPRPDAPHSGTIVPGVTGAAARKQDPPVAASQRFSQLNAASHAAASTGAAKAGTGSSLSSAKIPAAKPSTLTSWSGELHGGWGTSPNQTIYGAQATQSLNPGIVAPTTGSQFIYSPTLDPSGIDTIEMTTIYDGSGNYVGAWDWGAASPGFAKTAAINSTFLATYATKVSGQYYYTVQNTQTNPAANTWTAYLYNYTTGAWDTFYTSSSTGKLSNSGGGWDMDEVYTDYNSSTGEGDYCTLTSGDVFASTGIQYQLSSGGSWTPATTANSHTFSAYPRGSDLGCEGLSYSLPTADGTFQVTNATHAAGQIVGTGSAKCIDTPHSQFTNGTKEQIYTCNGTGAQSWTYNAAGELTVDGGKYCLDAVGYGTTSGTAIQIWQCNGTTNQEWTFSLNGTIVGIGSGLCLNVVDNGAANGHGTANGSTLQLWTCENVTNEQWSW